MAGVASGLALATTLMAMQVADSMSVRQCPYHVTMSVQPIAHEHGYLGVMALDARDDVATIGRVAPGTPAAVIGLQRGDHVVAVDGEPVHSFTELHDRIYNALPGHDAELVVDRDGSQRVLHATLAAFPVVRSNY
jgi:S1-C subfamily serine protease